jgi:hypothetical protein
MVMISQNTSCEVRSCGNYSQSLIIRTLILEHSQASGLGRISGKEDLLSLTPDVMDYLSIPRLKNVSLQDLIV